ncbi:MAG: hypothetical protein DRQ42_03180 [Gammaproteobacteria bacterium]|nr:MAG: hypothetical protein DRQ42_03180 [Gammaproteobacteria bacterium]
MRVVFFYYAKHQAIAKSNPSWDPKAPCAEGVRLMFQEEGLHNVFKKLLQEKVIDEVLVVVESNRGTGVGDFGGMKGYIVPEIWQILPYLREDDILFIRGGFRSWHNFLIEKHMHKWKMLYAANTGRSRWKWWDIVLDDLQPVQKLPYLESRGRLFLHYEKPINPDIFYKEPDAKIKYDVCLGASHVHDKKGQWLGIKALREYYYTYGKNLRVIMPGGGGRGVNTTPMYKTIPKLDIIQTGFVARPELRRILNASKLFCHFGGGGQNDRGPLEAMACGCPIAIKTPHRHGRVTWENKDISYVFNNDIHDMALDLHHLTSYPNGSLRDKTVNWFQQTSGIDNVVYPQFKMLFEFMNKHPKPTLEAKKGLLKEVQNG